MEALLIQFPERTGCEMITILSSSPRADFISSAFIDSLLWRSPESILSQTYDCIKLCIQHPDLHDRYLNVLLTLAVIPEHPLNADFLHERLIRESMADRDAWWSIFLFKQYGQKEAVDRLLNWAWSLHDKNNIEDDSIRLSGQALTWFLTTSHRFLRDRATKALVNLLSPRLQVLNFILHKFLTINDIYILERLLAVTYGCVLRTNDSDQITQIAQTVYDTFFKEGLPIPHILLRDYARGVIEFAICRGSIINIDEPRIRPPYKSKWVNIPTQEEIDALKIPENEETHLRNTRDWIFSSVMNWDFARYVIGTNNNGVSNWLSLSLNDPIWQSYNEIEREFVKSLTPKQLKNWELYNKAQSILDEMNGLNGPINLLNKPNSVTESQHEIEKQLAEAEIKFCNLLDKGQLIEYQTRIKPRITDSFHERVPYFDLSKVQRWIFKRVFDLGWTEERFGFFDNYHGKLQRDAQKPERIGKKYQWIAYHEILAYLADNYQFREDYSDWTENNQYQGAWQISVRDIDPTCVIRSINHRYIPANSWRCPSIIGNWHAHLDDINWIKLTKDFPNISTIIDLINLNDKHSHWLNLNCFYLWKQPPNYEYDPNKFEQREISIFIKSYLVHKQDADTVSRWFKRQAFSEHQLPNESEIHGIYFGELYWSPSYRHENPFGTSNWQTQAGYGNTIPKPICYLSEHYLAESGSFDCSIDESFSITIPTKHLIDGMHLQWNGTEGCFVDQSGQIIAYDPSVQENGPSSLLIHRQKFVEYLSKNGFSVIWVVTGEKLVIGESSIHDNWKGVTKAFGVFKLKDDKIDGKLAFKFQGPNDK